MASIIILLAIMNLSETLVLSLGHLVPPYIITSQPALFLSAASPERIRSLWRRHPSIEDLNELRSFLGARFNRLDPRDRRDADQWDSTAAKAYRLFTTLKFLGVWVFIVALVAIGTENAVGGELIRAFLAMAGLLVIALYQVAKFLYARMQQEYCFIDAVLTLPAEPVGALEVPEETRNSTLQSALNSDNRWWGIRLVNIDIIQWVWENLAPSRLARRSTGRKSRKHARGERKAVEEADGPH